ncbi:MAG TPA: hypothetical protein VFV02_17740 [Acidimicrobiales bacterium]|nr:hypothetical protein [Acidimicrobiales bacterium]
MEETELPMVCTCKPAALAEADALLSEVMRRLSEGSDVWPPKSVTMDNFLSAVVQSLNWDHGAHIASIDNDQWSAVTVEKYDGGLRRTSASGGVRPGRRWCGSHLEGSCRRIAIFAKAEGPSQRDMTSPP